MPLNYSTTRNRIRKPAIIDVEATGFHPHSYPIEVGIATSDGQRYSSLIKPYPNWEYWSEEAEAVHGISRQDLEKYGKPGKVVAEDLNRLLQNQTVYSDGWVVDKPWLIKLFDRARTPMNFWVSPLEMILTEQMMACWSDAKLNVAKDFDGQRHRASTDALFIQKTFDCAAELAGV
ncbi:hypothetical protein KOI40_09065 [Aestuariicella sp. G3-2]|uniref:3'-5' exonuclease n=1 Tax=Pseudomaricurvus albidus TaxID=2842452 RepID=UPI001C0AB234|nr:hypothetical protein [Aestuariicella albida]